MGGLSLRASDSPGGPVLTGAAKDSREPKDDRGATEEKAAAKPAWKKPGCAAGVALGGSGGGCSGFVCVEGGDGPWLGADMGNVGGV